MYKLEENKNMESGYDTLRFFMKQDSKKIKPEKKNKNNNEKLEPQKDIKAKNIKKPPIKYKTKKYILYQ